GAGAAGSGVGSGYGGPVPTGGLLSHDERRQSGIHLFLWRRHAMKRPRFLLGGVMSGSGKTTVACGLLQAFQNRGLRPSSFKCGPDYIDPMFHASVMGVKSGNLDG